jgi:DNA repair exonuclease SbcCD nuclease subunit
MFKFVHAADIHLDSPQRGLDRYEGAPVAECRGATRRALENLVDLAIRERAAFVLIVGDLYDGDWPDYNTGLFFGRVMSRLRDCAIPVYMIRGNHDAANRMTKDLRLLENVRVLSTEQAETVVQEDCGVAIHGRSFPTRAVLENLARAYPARASGLFNVGLLHTCVDGREGHEPYAPCSLSDLRAREYGYWALGHVHARETLHRDDPWIVFPGNLQGRHVREPGPKGCVLVTVGESQAVVAVEPRWLDVVRWETCRVDAAGARDGEEVVRRFQDRLDRLVPACDGRLLALRVEFQGACPAHGSLAARPTHWTNEVRQAALDAGAGRVWVEKVLLKTAPPGDPAAGRGDVPLAELVACLEELRADDARLRALGDRALEDLKRKLPSDLLDDLDGPERLRALLDQVGPLLFDRLLGPHSDPADPRIA